MGARARGLGGAGRITGPGTAALALATVLSLALHPSIPAARATQARMERVAVAEDQASFVLRPSGRAFVPWGFNYDHDRDGRLIEDYWSDEWERVRGDFLEMKELGANCVRVHLQFGRFMPEPDRPDRKSLARLRDLLRLAEETGLYLDVTGLGCYHAADVPPWYDRLDEAGRWRAQQRFWREVARVCARSLATFCYDLMNEPVVPGGKERQEQWLGPPFAGKHFVQFVTRERGDRARSNVARQWIRGLLQAIRKEDRRTLVTVGLVPWSLDRPGLTSGFVPAEIAGELDFVAVHLYPEKGRLREDLETLRGFDVGKPVLIEEIFPLSAGPEETRRFLEAAQPYAAGCLSFYWGTPPAQLEKGDAIQDALLAAWLREWRVLGPAWQGAARKQRSEPSFGPDH